MSAYELTFLLPDEDELKNLKTLVSDNAATVVSEEKWGNRKLAYPIKKHTSAHYFTWKIEVNEKDIAALKRKLNFNEKLIRYLLLKV